MHLSSLLLSPFSRRSPYSSCPTLLQISRPSPSTPEPLTNVFMTLTITKETVPTDPRSISLLPRAFNSPPTVLYPVSPSRLSRPSPFAALCLPYVSIFPHQRPCAPHLFAPTSSNGLTTAPTLPTVAHSPRTIIQTSPPQAAPLLWVILILLLLPLLLALPTQKTMLSLLL